MNERSKFVHLYELLREQERKEPNLTALCGSFGITRPTGYKWLARYEEGGLLALNDESRARREVLNRTPAVIADEIVRLRKLRSTWGPAKLVAVLKEQQPEVKWPAASTAGEILKKAGLIRPRRRRIRTAWMGTVLEGASEPNDVWAVDFKGHFALGSGERCHPLTLTDLWSRYILKCEGLARERVGEVKPQLELAFREFGLPKRLRSDNGGPFSSLAPGGLCPLAIWLIQLGVTPERIRPSSPQENGSHERMHRTLKAEATKPPGRTFAEQQRTFDAFRAVFNNERPHESLGQRPPATHYTSSLRAFPSEPKHPEYPGEVLVRRTNNTGRFSFKGLQIRTAKALCHAPVGLKEIDDDRWQLFYGPLVLGYLDFTSAGPFHRRRPRTWSTPPLASLAPAKASTHDPVTVIAKPGDRK